MIRNILLITPILYLIKINYRLSLEETNKFKTYFNKFINIFIPVIAALSTYIFDFNNRIVLFEILGAILLMLPYMYFYFIFN